MKEQMVCGFMFDEKRIIVALIRKNRPEWQEGFLNGVAGYVESNEGCRQAMIREFREETGVTYRDWQRFAKGESLDGERSVCFYRAFTDKIFKAETKTDERIELVVVRPNILSAQGFVPNLNWLIPLALDKTTLGIIQFAF